MKEVYKKIDYLKLLLNTQEKSTTKKKSRQENKTQVNYALERGPPPLEKLLPEGLPCRTLLSKARAAR